VAAPRAPRPASSPAVVVPAAAPTPESSSGGFKIDGKRISWDSVFVVAGGGLASWFLLQHLGGGSSTTTVSPLAPAQAAPMPTDTTTATMVPTLPTPPSATGPDVGPTDWWTPLYNTLEGRAPDPNGAAFWSADTIAVGQPAAEAAFLATPEAIVNSDYRTLLNRAPDSGGQQFYMTELQQGVSAATVQSQITSSAEYKSLHPTAK
jgi:Domain of unknown function (DUF4214)